MQLVLWTTTRNRKGNNVVDVVFVAAVVVVEVVAVVVILLRRVAAQNYVVILKYLVIIYQSRVNHEKKFLQNITTILIAKRVNAHDNMNNSINIINNTLLLLFSYM